MKRTLLLISGLFLTSLTQAQITLNSSGYPSSVMGTDSLETTLATPTFPSFPVATNGSWDLSTLPGTASLSYAYRVSPDTSAAQFADSNYYNFSTYTYQANLQSAITGTGLVEYGANIDSATFSASGATIYVPIQHSVFSAPYTVIKFPATMGTSWTSNYSSTFNYQATYSPVLSNTPGAVKSIITETDTVKGWGKMRIKDISGSPSSWFSVLQVQTTITTVDSFSLGGSYSNPLLPTLLGVLGVTQGQVTTTYYENYYRAGEVTPFANVQFTDATFDTATQVTTHTQRLIGAGVKNVVNNLGVNIYPNPVNGNIVYIDLPIASGAWAYELIDMSGKMVVAAPLQINGSSTQISLPASVTPGMYFIRLNNNGKEVCVRSIDVVK